MQVGTVVVLGTEPGRTGTPGHEPTPPSAPRATPLSDAEFRSATGAIDERLDARYAWDPGEAIGSFLEALRDGRILATFCSACMRTLVPPRKFCERCFRPTDSWTNVPDRGVVETFSICHVTWDMKPLAEPELPAVIRLHETSDGGFLHKLGEVSPEDVTIGMEVEAVWRPLDDRDGSILDIAYFRPTDPILRRSLEAAATTELTPA